MLIDVRRGRSTSFTATAACERAYRGMREAAKAGYIRLQRFKRLLMGHVRAVRPTS
jgi:hypothetical protein